jgi:putative transposase
VDSRATNTPKGSGSRKCKGYPTDVSDQKWKLIKPLPPGAVRTGRSRWTELRQVINALRYLVRAGCEWRMLPNDFPAYQTVYYWFRRPVRRFLVRTIHDPVSMLDRMCEEREVVPSAGIVDSLSVNTPSTRERGYDARKKISGRKRHIAVDTDGRLPAVNLTPADILDSTGAQPALDALAPNKTSMAALQRLALNVLLGAPSKNPLYR